VPLELVTRGVGAPTAEIKEREYKPRHLGEPARQAEFPRAWPLGRQATVAVLTLLALSVRLLVVRGFSLEEATVGYTARQSYGELLRLVQRTDHPPLEYTLLWVVAHTIGSSELELRLPSVVFGTLLVPMLYIAGRALYDERTGILAAAFGSVGALAVWYSQEASDYALLILLVTVSVWAQARLLQGSRPWLWVAWAAACGGMIWTEWSAVLVVGTETAVFLGALESRRRRHQPVRQLGRGLAISTVGTIIVCLPTLPLLLAQTRNKSGPGPGLTTTTFFPVGVFGNLGSAIAGYHHGDVIISTIAIWPLAVVIGLTLLGRLKQRSSLQMLAVVAIPVIVLLVEKGLVAQSRNPFQILYFVQVEPALYLLLAGAAWSVMPTPAARRIYISLLLATFIAGTVVQQLESANSRLEGSAWALAQINARVTARSEMVFVPSFLSEDIAYFAPGVKTAIPGPGITAVPASTQIFVVGPFRLPGRAVAERQAEAAVAKLQGRRALLKVLHGESVTVWEFA
jgi:uncharacterized membrane protein